MRTLQGLEKCINLEKKKEKELDSEIIPSHEIKMLFIQNFKLELCQ